MTTIITTNDDRHRLWVAMRLGLGAAAFPFTIGSVALENEDGQIYAAVLYHDFEEWPDTGRSMVWASIAALPKTYWCTRRFLKAILVYPFEVLGVCVLRTQCAKTNREARRFNEHLGLKRTGCARRSWDGTRDAIHYDMLPHEAAKWLGYEPTEWKDRATEMKEANHG